MICQCAYKRSPDDRCRHPMTQEDGLCDGCRQLHPQASDHAWARLQKALEMLR